MLIFNSTYFTKNEKTTNAGSWKIFLADAAGGLSGGGSVISLGGGLCPPCVGIGATIGAAGASIGAAFLQKDSTSINDINNEWALAANPINDHDHIGVEHNKLVRSFIQSGKSPTFGNYITFVKGIKFGDSNNIKIDEQSYIHTSQFFESEFTEVQVFELIQDNLPKSINQVEFMNDLNNIFQGDIDKKKLIYRIKVMEAKYIFMTNLSSTESIQLKSFFSILRYSSVLWK